MTILYSAYRLFSLIFFCVAFGYTYPIVLRSQLPLIVKIGFVAMLFFSFIGGVLLYDSQENSSLEKAGEKWVSATAYILLSMSILIEVLYTPTPYFYFIPSITVGIWVGFTAQQNYMNGNQPFQKYEWVPRNPLYTILIPYYYYKYKTSNNED